MDGKEFAIEEDAVFIILGHPLFKVWPPGQSIGFVESTRMVEDREMELQEKKGPMGLTAGKFLFRMKVCKVVVVSPDLERVLVTFKVVAEMFKSTDDGKEFFVMNFVIEFSGLHAFGVKGDRVPVIKEVGLFKDGAEGVVRGICYKTIRTCGIGKQEDRGAFKN